MSASDAPPTLAKELRRRRTALGWTLEQVAEQAQVSVGMLSLIETGKRRPSLRSWTRIRQTLGITEPLPEEAWRQQPQEISDEVVATLGACLAAVRSATLAELAAATGLPISDVRLALRRLADRLELAGMQVLDDGSHVLLAPEKRFHDAVAQLVQPAQVPRLTQEQAEVLAIVISDGMATRRRIEGLADFEPGSLLAPASSSEPPPASQRREAGATAAWAGRPADARWRDRPDRRRAVLGRAGAPASLSCRRAARPDPLDRSTIAPIL
jgi:transcriptional regulator with XRE-family HTH domain